MPKRFLLAIFTAMICLLTVSAQTPTTIAEYLQHSSAGRVTVHQPEALNQRLSPTSGDTTNVATHHHFRGKKEIVGYRIQVFSDRNQRTAKSEALSRERNIKEAFPEMGTYITYDAPSWRLRVGDFRTRDEAASRLAELKELFPGYDEMIIVVDLINTAAQ